MAKGHFQISLEPYPLDLATVWGQAFECHHYGFNQIRCRGYGEVGMPAKKKFCYVADYNDVLNYFVSYASHVNSYFSHSTNANDCSLSFIIRDQQGSDVAVPDLGTDSGTTVYDNVFGGTSKVPPHRHALMNVCQFLISMLDATPNGEDGSGPASSRPCRSGIEMALIDVMSQLCNMNLHDYIGIPYTTPRQTYLTVSMKPSIDEMIDEAALFMTKSHCIKIKMDTNIKLFTDFLPRFATMCRAVPDGDAKISWVIDANASWTPEFVGTVSNILEPFIKKNGKGFLVGIEQPFPAGFPRYVPLDQQTSEAWSTAVKMLMSMGLEVFADESCNDASDIPYLKPYVSGINIKLEKCPGYRAALYCIDVARSHGLKVWIGMMVASLCGTAAHANLLPAADLGGDVDGGLCLVHPKSDLFTGGLHLASEPVVGAIVLEGHSGLGLKKK